MSLSTLGPWNVSRHRIELVGAPKPFPLTLCSSLCTRSFRATLRSFHRVHTASSSQPAQLVSCFLCSIRRGHLIFSNLIWNSVLFFTFNRRGSKLDRSVKRQVLILITCFSFFFFESMQSRKIANVTILNGFVTVVIFHRFYRLAGCTRGQLPLSGVHFGMSRVVRYIRCR